jgi:HD-like signal output (HDOD) protein
MGSFNLHSAGVGILADLLAVRTGAEYAEGAFAAGLFHDLGWLLIAIGLPEEFKQISLLCRQNEKWASEYEVQLLGMAHADLSADALATWNLPEPIQTAVRYHCSPKNDPAASEPGVPLSRILHVADRYVQRMGNSLSVFENNIAEGDENILETLELGDRLPAILTEFDNEFAAIKPYF